MFDMEPDMGLDGVELIMAVEEKFGISISDEEAQRVLTVGDMKRLVRAKLDITDSASCLTQRHFMSFGKMPLPSSACRDAICDQTPVWKRLFR